MPSLSLGERRLVVCLGPGGVGKTTIAAALAVANAMARRTVDVMTVDPAPRLLDALGLDAACSEPQPVDLGNGAQARGRLRALKLDPKRTFDELVARYAPSEPVREAILENRLYRNLSQALAGVADYMAMEKLLELASNPATELVVLDTPPAGEALDFLDAPRRLLELLNSRAATLLGASHGFLGQGLTMFDLAARAVLRAFDRLAGLRLLDDVQAFVRSFDGMYQGFADRAARAQSLLGAGQCQIVLITTAEGRRVEEVRAFIESLAGAGLEVDALVVNRVLPILPVRAAVRARSPLPGALRRKLQRNWKDFAALKARQTASLEALRAMIPPRAVMAVAPDLGREPTTVTDLAELAAQIEAA